MRTPAIAPSPLAVVEVIGQRLLATASFRPTSRWAPAPYGPNRALQAPPRDYARRVNRNDAPILTAAEVEEYRAQGFACVDRPLFSPTALGEVRRHLDHLFERYDRIPFGFAQDLDPQADGNATPRIPEINFTTVLAPRLLRSAPLRVCTQIARQLHGPQAHLVFDHAIYKPGSNGAATPWHQDAAYAKPNEQVVGFWVPLQSVGIDNGCMRFVPKSHLAGLIEHDRLATATNPRLRVAHPAADDIVYCPVCEGGVVLHNSLTLHSTGANEGATTRRVWILNFGVAGRAQGPLNRRIRATRVRAGIAVRRLSR